MGAYWPILVPLVFAAFVFGARLGAKLARDKNHPHVAEAFDVLADVLDQHEHGAAIKDAILSAAASPKAKLLLHDALSDVVGPPKPLPVAPGSSGSAAP